jgi:hypothetical protein
MFRMPSHYSDHYVEACFPLIAAIERSTNHMMGFHYASTLLWLCKSIEINIVYSIVNTMLSILAIDFGVGLVYYLVSPLLSLRSGSPCIFHVPRSS